MANEDGVKLDATETEASPAQAETKPKRRSRAKATAAAVDAPQAEAQPADAKAKPKRRSRAKGTAGSNGGGHGGALVIVESPTKAKTIGKYLGSGYTVKATVGHVRDLPKRELGVDVEHGFTPKYVTIKGKTKTLTEIKKAAKASDARAHRHRPGPRRRGDRLARGRAGRQRRQRPACVVPRDHQGRGRAGARATRSRSTRTRWTRSRHGAFSIAWWATRRRRCSGRVIKTGLSAGRVQTVALRLIVEREDAIRKFVPQEYWTIEADLEKDGQAFQARLHKLDGHKPEIKDAATAQAIVDEALQGPLRGHRRRRARSAGSVRRHPFTTSTLQQEAAKQLGFSAKRTMRAAQGLYEGSRTSARRAQVGLITYMRTDSTRVADSAIAQARDFIAAQFDKRYLPETPNVYGGTKGGQSRVQDAHEAVRPTEVMRRPEDVQQYLEAGPVQALSAHLEALRRFADDSDRVRDDDGGLRPRPLPVPGDGLACPVRRVSRALPRGA